MQILLPQIPQGKNVVSQSKIKISKKTLKVRLNNYLPKYIMLCEHLNGMSIIFVNAEQGSILLSGKNL